MSPLACPICASGKRCVRHGPLLDDDPYDVDPVAVPRLVEDVRGAFLLALETAQELAERVIQEHPKTVDAARAAYLLDALPTFRAQGLRTDTAFAADPEPASAQPGGAAGAEVLELDAFRGRPRPRKSRRVR